MITQTHTAPCLAVGGYRRFWHLSLNYFSEMGWNTWKYSENSRTFLRKLHASCFPSRDPRPRLAPDLAVCYPRTLPRRPASGRRGMFQRGETFCFAGAPDKAHTQLSILGKVQSKTLIPDKRTLFLDTHVSISRLANFEASPNPKGPHVIGEDMCVRN